MITLTTLLNPRLFLNPGNWQQSKYMNINLGSLGLKFLQMQKSCINTLLILLINGKKM